MFAKRKINFLASITIFSCRLEHFEAAYTFRVAFSITIAISNMEKTYTNFGQEYVMGVKFEK